MTLEHLSRILRVQLVRCECPTSVCAANEKSYVVNGVNPFDVEHRLFDVDRRELASLNVSIQLVQYECPTSVCAAHAKSYVANGLNGAVSPILLLLFYSPA